MEIEENENKIEENQNINQEQNKKYELKAENKVSVNDISLVKEENEKIKFFEQFWVIEKILINPFMVCIKIFIFKRIFNL